MAGSEGQPVSTIPAEAAPAVRLVVGIGASAGGLEALRALFEGMPGGLGCCFLVAQHLDPNRPSLMADLIGREAVLPVAEAVDGQVLKPDTVAVLPPDRLMTVEGDHIRLGPLEGDRIPSVTIDRLFHSLAESCGERAVGIVLSGSGSDGTSGLRAIIEQGGLAVAQDPQTAEHGNMPGSAIAAKAVDLVLPVRDMPGMLSRYLAAGHRPTVAELVDQDASAVDRIEEAIDLINRHSQNDFRQYKRLTVLRRLDRRMSLRHIARLDDYVDLLKSDEDELAAMAHDLLISVTAFFRNRLMFEVLAREVAPALIRQRGPDEPVRIWVCGCATGEEAYTFAMVFLEALEALRSPRRLQIFASDIDTQALIVAREGRYPASIAAAVGPARLARFFVQSDQFFRVAKSVRDCIIFGEHNLLSDPPFSQMDLISCQNVLIYIDSPVQDRIMPLFHYALRPGGFLALGPAETATGAHELFREHANGEHLYRRIDDARVSATQMTVPFPRQFPWRTHSGRTPPAPEPAAGPSPVALIANAIPAAVLINETYDIQYFHGDTGRYLSPAPGSPSANLLSMARPGLRLQVRGLVYEARETGQVARRHVLMDRETGPALTILLTAHWVPEDPPLCVVTFEEMPDLAVDGGAPQEGMPALQVLERELEATRHDLKSTIAELERSNENLRASHVEVLAVNEELQSSNEELETSKEELQALNEELSTVNSELENKITEMKQLTGDLENLIAATDMPILFLDRDANIRRYTPATQRLLNLRLGDIGRPIADFALPADSGDVDRMTGEVLRTRAAQETVLRLRDGRHLKQRITPYRTADGLIEGVVAVFTDVTDLVASREEEANQRSLLTAVLDQAADAIVVCDPVGNVLLVNQAAIAMSEHADTQPPTDLSLQLAELYWGRVFDADGRPMPLGDLIGARERHGETVHDLRCRLMQSHRTLDILVSGSPVYDAEQRLIATIASFRDITREVADQHQLAESEARYRSLLDCIPHGIFLKPEAGRYAMMNRAAADLFGTAWPFEEALHDRDVFPAPLARLQEDSDRRVMNTGKPIDRDFALPGGRTLHLVKGPYRDAANQVRGVFGVAWDVTRERQREHDLRTARQAAENASAAKSSFLRGMSHDLRSPLNAVIGFAEALLAGIYGPIDSDRQHEPLESILQSGGYLLGIINQVLDIARMESGAVVLEREPVDAAAAINKAAKIAPAGLKRPLAAIRLDLPADPVKVTADEVRFTEVIVNLLSNALKWTPPEGEVRIAFAEPVADGQVRLAVADTGSGMTGRQIAEAFEPFRTGERDIMITAEERDGSSFGLGLVVVKQIVDLHGATITIDSQPGEGTTVTLDWPAAAD